MKANVKIIVSLALVVIGLIGTLVCVTPSASSEYKTVKKYISAVNSCNDKAIKACMPIDEYSQVLGIDLDDVTDSEAENRTSRYDYLKASGLSVSKLVPENAKEVKKISLICCNKTDSHMEDLFSSSMVEVDSVIRVTYKSEDDKTVSVTDTQRFTLAKTSKGYKIVG